MIKLRLNILLKYNLFKKRSFSRKGRFLSYIFIKYLALILSFFISNKLFLYCLFENLVHSNLSFIREYANNSKNIIKMKKKKSRKH